MAGQLPTAGAMPGASAGAGVAGGGLMVIGEVGQAVGPKFAQFVEGIIQQHANSISAQEFDTLAKTFPSMAQINANPALAKLASEHSEIFQLASDFDFARMQMEKGIYDASNPANIATRELTLSRLKSLSPEVRANISKLVDTTNASATTADDAHQKESKELELREKRAKAEAAEHERDAAKAKAEAAKNGGGSVGSNDPNDPKEKGALRKIWDGTKYTVRLPGRIISGTTKAIKWGFYGALAAVGIDFGIRKHNGESTVEAGMNAATDAGNTATTIASDAQAIYTTASGVASKVSNIVSPANASPQPASAQPSPSTTTNNPAPSVTNGPAVPPSGAKSEQTTGGAGTGNPEIKNAGPTTPAAGATDPKAAITACLPQPKELGDRQGKDIHPQGSNQQLENPDGICAFHFAYDRADAPPPADAKANAVKLKTWLDQHKGQKIWIMGGCDTDGSEEYNKKLGMRRATASRDALIKASDGQLKESDFELVSNGKDVLWKNQQGKVPENRYAVMFGGPPRADVAPAITPNTTPQQSAPSPQQAVPSYSPHIFAQQGGNNWGAIPAYAAGYPQRGIFFQPVAIGYGALAMAVARYPIATYWSRNGGFEFRTFGHFNTAFSRENGPAFAYNPPCNNGFGNGSGRNWRSIQPPPSQPHTQPIVHSPPPQGHFNMPRGGSFHGGWRH